MVGWHHQLNGHEFEQAPGVGDGQGSPVWGNGVAKSDTTEWLNWTELSIRCNIMCKLFINIYIYITCDTIQQRK